MKKGDHGIGEVIAADPGEGKGLCCLYKFKKDALRIVKIFHLFAACCWVGGAMAMITLNLNNAAALSEGSLYGINFAAHLIDSVVVAACGALGCLITSLIYGVFTNWGFFKYKWIMMKWLLAAFSLTSAILFLGPGEEAMLELSREFGNLALNNDSYLAVKAKHLFWSVLQISSLYLMIILSVFKPWGKRDITKSLANKGC